MKLNTTYHPDDEVGGSNHWTLECSDGVSRTVGMIWGRDSTSSGVFPFVCGFFLSETLFGTVSAIVDRNTGVITDFVGKGKGDDPLPFEFLYDRATNKLTCQLPDADGATITIDFSEVRIKERETEDITDKIISFKEPMYCEQERPTNIKNHFGKGDTRKYIDVGSNYSFENLARMVKIEDTKTRKWFKADLTLDKDGNVTSYTISTLTSGFSADGKTRGSSYSADEPIKLYTTPGNGTETFTLDLSGMRFIETSEENPAEVEEEPEREKAFVRIQSLAITEDGILTGSFKDGSTRSLYQLAMANCPAPNKMTEKSGGFYIPTPDSGNLHVGTSGSSGLGIITPRSLEESTTDIATELANAIQTQYVYAANAKTIATASEMLETLLKVEGGGRKKEEGRGRK